MNYIYDIVLNFNKLYYDFYEWKESDNLLNFRKIPLFKIDDRDYKCFKYDDIVIDKYFIDIICDKSYVVGNNDKYIACLLSNGREVMGINVDKNGNLLGRSSLLLDEEEEVIDDIIELGNYQIIYNIKKKFEGNRIFSRSINDKKIYINDFFNNNDDLDLYKYIYYDFYEKEEKNIDKIKKKFLSIINNDWDNNCEKLYNNIKVIDKVR